MGFRGLPLAVIQSYLMEMRQCTEVNGVRSGFACTTCGVPQGTILGPLLFNLYVNELYALDLQGSVWGYADDTVLVYGGKTWDLLQHTVALDLVKLSGWLEGRQLKMNCDKTKFVPFSSYASGLPSFGQISVEVGGVPLQIQRANSIKYLGLHVDCHLRWNIHAEYTVKKIRSQCSTFRYLSGLLDCELLKSVYRALIEPHLRYGIIGWGAMRDIHMSNLNVAHRKILKIMFGRPYYYPSNQLFLDARLMDIRQLYFLCCVTRQFSEKTECIEHSYNVRHSSTVLPVPRMQKSIGQRSHLYLKPRLFNELPVATREARTLPSFKSKVKEYMRQKSREYIRGMIAW